MSATRIQEAGATGWQPEDSRDDDPLAVDDAAFGENPGWWAKVARRIPRPGFSRLTARIIAINVLVLLIPVFGLLWTNQYYDNLLETEIELLETEGNIVAVMVANAGTIPIDAQSERLSGNKARQLIQVLNAESPTRLRVFGLDGSLLVDSRSTGTASKVEITPLNRDYRARLRDFEDNLKRFFSPDRIGVPRYEEPLVQNGDAFPEVHAAFSGDTGSSVMQDKAGELILSVALPIRRYKKVLGVLLVSRDRTGIDDAVSDIRIKILQFFLIALLIMLLLSFWLSGSIVRPVIALARGADRVRNGKPYQYEIPDFSKRRDEIGELSHSLRDMTHALWNRLDAIDSFAADVSHEIKNPLTSIKSALETSEMIQDPEKKAMLMGVALADIERLDRLITDISNASRLDAELSRGDSEIVDIRELLTTLVESGNLTRRDDGPVLALKGMKSGTLFVKGIEGRLGQVLTNLIGNAASFSPPGGEINLGVRRKGQDFLQIHVDDQGPGIQDDKLEAVFNRFYTDRPDSSFGSHSGLGLSISRQIALAHGGDLVASNHRTRDGRIAGARFTLTLPVYRA